MKKQLINFITAASLCSLFFASCPSFAQVPNYVPSNGIIGWWPFNGNANDESGNGNNGIVTNASLSVDRFGIPTSSYYFDGNSKIISNISNLPIDSNPRSISAWFKWDSTEAIWDHRIVNYGSCPVNTNNHTFGLSIWNNVDPGNAENAKIVLFSCGSSDVVSSLTPNKFWHHAVATYDGTIQKLYFDGILIDSLVFPLLTNNSTPLIIGANTDFTNVGNFNGKIDDIGIWNRALTEAEIVALYNGCSNSLSAQPTDQSIELSAGNTAQFSVTSSAITASYQWQTNLGLGFQNLSDAGQYSGTATNTLSVNNVTLANNNQQFRCIVADGSCEDTTDVAVLTVIDDLGIDDLKPNGSKKLLKITDLNGKETPFRKNIVLLFIYEDGTLERVFEAE